MRNSHRQPSDSACAVSAWPVILVALLLCSACSTVTTQSFKPNPNSVVEVAYVATDADFSRYSRLLGEDMGIFSPASRPLSAEDSQRLRQIFRNAFLDELTDYEFAGSAAPDVMTVQASLIDLRNGDLADVPNLRAGLDAVAQPGVLMFTMEMRDSSTNRVLARAADNTNNPRIGSSNGGSTDWDAVQIAARHWASLFRAFLDENLSP